MGATVLDGQPEQAPAEQFPAVILSGSEERPLSSKISGRDYLLYVNYPSSYWDTTEKKYPVVYILDPYWDFPLVTATYFNMLYDEVVPEMIIVGIGYKDKSLNPAAERTLDLSPTKVPRGSSGLLGESGGAGLFLQAIEMEIIPYVESHLRVDPEYRVLGGTSLGGLFTLFAMYERPGLFNAYIAISPAVSWDGRWLIQHEADLFRSSRNDITHPEQVDFPARLFMSVAGDEWVVFRGDILAFDQILKHANYRGFEYEFKHIEGARHSGTKAESWTRGLKYAFEPYRLLNPPPKAGG